MMELAHTALGLGALFAALTLWQRFARRGGALVWILGVALAAFGTDTTRQLYWQVVDQPGGGPARATLFAIGVALALSAWLRWRELGVLRAHSEALETYPRNQARPVLQSLERQGMR